MSEDLALDLAIAPDGAIGRIGASINKRGKRAFGVLKTANEYVGVVRANEFELWERQQRAVHARGRVVARHRGSRVEVNLVIPRRTRFLLGLFFALYLLVSLGIATQPPDPSVSAGEVLVSIAGAGVLAALFTAGARSQRADLRTFFERVFDGVARL
ncbi:MAG: hypothetical protein AUH85_05375 [Chloroflexi bacterium 13_1_40CM_4_68_4]|nr:MAG: hypothetical protein AUH85_05375 [Chloroflexi bacterium 13_1_40CM_4_68_4]